MFFNHEIKAKIRMERKKKTTYIRIRRKVGEACAFVPRENVRLEWHIDAGYALRILNCLDKHWQPNLK